MAGYDFEFYETGSISVTAGQKAFTGAGTAWKIRGCEGALIIVSGAGAVNFVSTLSTDSAGEFRTAWTGPTLANALYTMWLPSAVSATALANHQRLAEIIVSIQAAQPASDNLAALAALAGSPDFLPIFTAPGTFGLISKSDIGIQDPKGSLAKLAAVTLAARQILQTNASGALTTVNLSANKIIRTNASSDISLGDITDAAAALLALAGAANQFPYYTSASVAALAAITAAGRAGLNTSGTAAADQLQYLTSTTASALTALTSAGRAGINTAGTAAANQLPYLTSGTASALTALTAYARTILDDADGAAVWATLGATQTAGTNGFFKLPNGIIVQWGTVTITGGDLAVTLPTVFTTANFGVLISSRQSTPSSATSYYGASADGLTLSGFSAHGRYAANGGSVGVAAVLAGYLAIGI